MIHSIAEIGIFCLIIKKLTSFCNFEDNKTIFNDKNMQYNIRKRIFFRLPLKKCLLFVLVDKWQQKKDHE